MLSPLPLWISSVSSNVSPAGFSVTIVVSSKLMFGRSFGLSRSCVSEEVGRSAHASAHDLAVTTVVEVEEATDCGLLVAVGETDAIGAVYSPRFVAA